MADLAEPVRSQTAHARPGRPRLLSPDFRRGHLIDAAEDVFLERGYHAATMNDIAARAGMSKKTVYQVFPSKDLLFDALLSDRLAVLSLPIEEDGREPEVVLVDLLVKIALFLLSPRQIAMTRLIVAETQRAPEIGQALERLGLGRGNGALEKYLAAQSAAGRIPLVNPQETATMLFGFTAAEILLKQLICGEPIPGVAEIERRARLAVRMVLAQACAR
jgi:TetR/AcrR family transcriptional regulator of autoinduction and epiphytic fitness